MSAVGNALSGGSDALSASDDAVSAVDNGVPAADNDMSDLLIVAVDAEDAIVARLNGYEAIMDASLFKAFKPQYRASA